MADDVIEEASGGIMVCLDKMRVVVWIASISGWAWELVKGVMTGIRGRSKRGVLMKFAC